jgi:hypothetical protein
MFILSQHNDNMQEIAQIKTSPDLSLASPLGNYVKSATPYNSFTSDNSSNIRGLRYALQDKIQLLLHKNTDDHQFKNTKKCMRTSHSSTVTVHHSQKHNKAFYGNLVQCANVWACPVCSAKIQQRRAKEISTAVFHAYNNGKKAIMITLTQPHTRLDSLASIVDKHKHAIKQFKSGKQFTNFTTRTGCSGKIRSTEVTYSKRNGWHYHVHELWFVDQDCDINSELKFLKQKWFNACSSAGFSIPDLQAFNKHSVDVMDNAHTSDYLAKSGQSWGADKELTGGASKKGYGSTPFDLANSADPSDNQRFLEYVHATRGKAQLYWSRGLKALVGITDKTDQQLAEEQEEQAILVAHLDNTIWLQILHTKARSTLLSITEKGGYNALSNWLAHKYGFTLHPPDLI